ncbi:MAG: hypothetical protein J0H41_06285, partial [Rhizobiales bacterium]|nr:hypothetical protein [Hyphomicrobiales bacterium]
RIAIIGADRAEAGDVVAEVAQARAASGGAILVALSGAVAPADYRGAGLLDLARGEAGYAEVIHRARQSSLHVMPRGEGDLEDLVDDADSLDAILDALSNSYDNVVIDLPFDLSAEERAAFAAHVDHIAIVQRGDAPSAETAELFSSLRALLARDPLVLLLPSKEPALKSAA